MNQFKYKDNRGDYIISFAVMMQSLLMLIQLTLIDVFHIEHEVSTTFRVLLTAIPMILAMMVSVSRNMKLWVITLFFVFLLSLYTLAFFPENSEFIMSQGLRFTLPICIPSLLCLCTIRRIEIAERMLYFISWFCVAVVAFYFVQYFRGVFIIDSYDMAFSYSCLLPMVVLYARKSKYSIIASLLMFIIVLAIGSRGAALYYLVFVVFDMFQTKNKWRWVPLILGIAILVLLPYLPTFFESIGLHSRTLTMLLDGNIDYDSGRGDIAEKCWNVLYNESPILGLGVFGDFVIVGNYCHNIFLEILVDFGLIAGFALILFLISKLIRVYFHSIPEYRNKIMKYFCALILPFMTSGSYLISSDFWMFLGLCILIERTNKGANVEKKHIKSYETDNACIRLNV